VDAILRAAGLVKSYGQVRAVDGVDLEVYPKEIYGLLGPNGSGKTTTLSMLAGVLRPDEGAVKIDAVSVARSAARLKLGFVPQEIALYPQMTAAENVRFFGRMQGLHGQRLRERTADALELVGLGTYANRRVATFSSGMKRRANIAVALVHSPEVLIMDEPTVGVDPHSRNAILQQLTVLADAGCGIVFASHYMEEVQRLCTRIGIIDAGKIMATGTVAELMARSAARSRIVLTAAGECEATLRSLVARLPDDATCRSDGHEFHIQARQADELLGQLLPIATDAGIAFEGIQLIQPTLEDAFLEFTGKDLRE